ncbi:dinuclear metal center protein, YbgI/SA1388 family [Desulfitobacterium dichloroeliminans LMG P-21439]|uniref:GTP cyclohydrolase 1 type 2 homolog n=1 Tax=Desulfitobacterium dichloroeliminans (strain LMG P-21439 / DCA1) TaxID=871963 RepID=L0FBK9_DESDL|nr:Nif3-like dinuclear metal center hexameric protein [Desulfitobacterium dichloroeliminans]AGA70338.1 dinuclear metal center protein, YbgI/SA1388 family [Desulfitobacterium dichloroeliminans LMG P-21439]
MPVSVGVIAQTIEKIAPKAWAEEWDNVGLLVGSFSSSVERVLVTLDLTPGILEEAIQKDAQLIVAHHPIMFRPLKNLRSDSQGAHLPLKLVQAGIGYYAAHTNLDQTTYSSCWSLGKALALDKMEYLRVTDAAHPYEEPAYDLIPLFNTGATRGYGVMGYLKEPVSLEAIASLLTVELKKLAPSNLEGKPVLRLAGDSQRRIRKVAIVNGSGGSFIAKALFNGVDLLITGDVDHHEALDALEAGLSIIDMGHFWGEVPMVQTLAGYLSNEKALAGVDVLISQRMKSPWQSL